MLNSKNSIGGELNVLGAKRAQRTATIIRLIITYLFLAIMAVIVIFPFYWMIISSLKTMDEYRENVPTLWPRNIVWQNFTTAFDKANLKDLFLHTLYVGVVSTALSLVVTVLSAFAFARLQFKGKNLVFGLLMATMMVPGELYTITNYLTVSGNPPFSSESVSWMDITNTFAVLIFPMLVSVFYIYLLRQTFMQIPNELYLAAKVDGTSDFKYLWKVMLPLSVSTLITITILKMMGAWNSYIWPRLVANDAAHRLVTNGLRNAFHDAAKRYGWTIYIPKFSYTTDNAAMIGIVGYYKFLDKVFCPIDAPAFSKVTFD